MIVADILVDNSERIDRTSTTRGNGKCQKTMADLGLADGCAM